MKSVTFASSLILAGILAAGNASAEYPYGSWSQSDTDITKVKIEDSFNKTATFTKSESQDNDVSVSKDFDYSLSSSEDNDVEEDNDITISKDWDYTSSYQTSEDNDVHEDNDITVSKDWDYTSSYETSEDNDVVTTITEDNDVHTDLDFQIATPTMSSYKHQDQDAGHQADTSVLGVATGHSVGVEGSSNLVSAGNEDTVYYGPALVNTNTNQLPQNNLMIGGSNGAPISQANTFAGRDMGPKGFFGTVGETNVGVSGSVGNQSGASVDQAGDSANSIADPFSSSISN
ncbi:MAG: hypothetical protein OES38_18815 [Gammaproteobacteria bacterium]|nr:hypothetical protein [Gammaproteobacteria bacterium]